MRRRVVITGLGVVSPFGLGADALWEGLLSGECRLGPIERFDAAGFRSALAGEIKDFSVRDMVPRSYRKAVKVMARDTEIAVGAARLAIGDAGIQTKATLEDAPEPASGSVAPSPTYPATRVGCHIGAGLIAAETLELTSALVTARAQGDDHALDLDAWGAGAMNNLPPLWMLKYLPNMLACHVTILHDARGPSNTITCAEASGALSIGESMRVIERGDADACFTGGAESKINHMGVLRMDLAGRLAPTRPGADPRSFGRPFDPDSPGQILGEAGAILIVEGHDSALARGARVYAELAGFGAGHSPRSADPAERALGLAAAIKRALHDARCDPAEIDAIVPHAAGFVDFDDEEAAALRSVFAARLKDIPLITLTPAIGDSMAGQSAVQVAVAAMAVRRQALPARLHAGTPATDLMAGRAGARDARLRKVLVTVNALGGQNAALVLQSVP